VIDEIVSEPVGGAHIDPDMAARLLGQALRESLADLEGVPGDDLRRRRRARFRSLGVFA
jgi:acetyl-CoA carboxylase carboxyl transferase subunit alpha